MDAYAASLAVGDALWLRGPVGSFAYARGDAARLVCIASGVGTRAPTRSQGAHAY